MLPEGIPTVTVTGRFLSPDGRPLTGQLVWRAPALLTFSEHDVILGGPVTTPLDSTGSFEIELPATDAPGMNPDGWSYTVAEQFAGVSSNRTYQILLPAESPEVDLADLAPTDPTDPNYVAVRGDSAYEVAVEQGFEGTEAEWLESLIGEQGPQGAQGETGPEGPEGPEGPQGPEGDPGIVQSVNGYSTADVTLDAADVGAVPDTAPGAPNGVAELDGDGKVPAEQLPDTAGAVESVNGQTGEVTLDAGDVAAVPASDKGAADGVAELDGDGKVREAQLLPYGIRPADVGMAAWAFDPAASQTGGRTPSDGSFRFTAVPVRESTTVSAIVFHVFGYEGTGLDTGSNAGIFDSSGTLVEEVGDMAGTSKMIDEHDAGGTTQAVALSSSVTLSPGMYYVGFWWTYTDSADAPVIMTADSSSACPVVTLNAVEPFGIISGMAAFPGSFTPSDNEGDPIRFWAGLA